MKGVVFDIETTSLSAIGSGAILCAVTYDVATHEETIFRFDKRKDCRPGDEWPMIAALVAKLGEYDLLIGQNIIKFDLPFIRSRCVYFGKRLDLMPWVYDTLPAFKRIGYRTVLNAFGKPSASLGHIIDFFGEKQEKTGIFPRRQWDIVWKDRGSAKDKKIQKEAMDALVDHCSADVRMTEKIYQLLMREDLKGTIRRWM